MGAANFHRTNAEDTYVIYDRYTDEDEGQEVLRDWRDIKDDVVWFGKENGWEPICKSFGRGMDSDTGILRKEFRFEYSTSGIEYIVDAYITINAGYYEHCNLDYRFILDGSSDDDSLNDILEMMVDDFIEGDSLYYLSYYNIDKKHWNRGLCIMQKHNFRRAAEEFLDKVKDECEFFCKNRCDDTYRCVARFSNGEAFYEKVG